MKKIAIVAILVALALGAYWALARAGVAPSYRCGLAPDPEGTVRVCYWDTRDRLF
jgi:hypothetical protein